jgi:hypothetical protein
MLMLPLSNSEAGGSRFFQYGGSYMRGDMVSQPSILYSK